MQKVTLFVLLALVSSLVACGGGSAPQGGEGEASAGDASAGQELFSQPIIGSQAGCVTCHSLEPGKAGAGPSLAKIGTAASSRVSGQSAEEYLRNSIVTPNDHIAEGFGSNIMPATYGNQMSEQEISDLVAYLLTLK